VTDEYDFVIAGAGHNSLITAAYLAKAGYSCVIVEERGIPGGGAATEEILLPGLGIDTCSTGHTIIQTNPLIANDELGLVADHGLAYEFPDPVAHIRFQDGEFFTMRLDVEATVAEFSRFSAADGRTYRRMLDDYDSVKHIFGGARFSPVGYGRSVDDQLAEHPRGGIWQRRQMLSAHDVIRHEFESRHAQSFLMWMAFQTLVAPDLPGTGLLASSLIYGRQQRSWSIPMGGSGRLVDALVGYLDDRGVEIHCGQRVNRLIVEDGRCVGIETDQGASYRAKQAVVSTIHVKHLVDMAPAEAWGDDFTYAVETYDVGISGFATYLATSEPPAFETPDGQVSSVCAGIAGWPEEMVANARKMRDGVFFEDTPFLLVATPTIVDQTRVEGGLHTVKLLSAQTYELPEGKDWETTKDEVADRHLAQTRRFAPSFTDDKILGRLVHSPDDIEAWNAHMIRGAFHGGDRTIAFSGAQRPAPGWAQHRMPIPGLYQTGGTTHPGGSITGAPGRNAAIVILDDLGTSLEAVLAR
jgi:phytoene dehydrogenase-like protein